jgi:hypothetical protein
MTGYGACSIRCFGAIDKIGWIADDVIIGFCLPILKRANMSLQTGWPRGELKIFLGNVNLRRLDIDGINDRLLIFLGNHQGNHTGTGSNFQDSFLLLGIYPGT